MTTEEPRKRVALVIDYQNVHNTARDVFDPDGPLHDSLIDPLKFAKEIERLKGEAGWPITVTHIEVYRGLPDESLPGHAYNTAQRDRWLQSVSTTVDLGSLGGGGISPAHIAPKKLPTMEVELRPLRYPKKWDDDKKKRVPDPQQRGVEKGVDVLVALAVVRLAQRQDIDTVILASQDTDLAPALEVVVDGSLGHVETVRWFDEDNEYTMGRLGTVWCTRMERKSYMNSRDTRDYSSVVTS